MNAANGEEDENKNGINRNKWMAFDVEGERDRERERVRENAWKCGTVFVKAIIAIAIGFECNMNREKVSCL